MINIYIQGGTTNMIYIYPTNMINIYIKGVQQHDKLQINQKEI